jgi:hypothetical protein
MALKACQECKKEISSDATTCPLCGKKAPHGTSKIVSVGGGFLSLVFGGVLLFMFFGGGIEKQAAKDMQQITNQVAQDQVAQYNIAKRNGDAMQICVQAGMVSAAFLQSNDEPNFNKWKAVEKQDCAAAGLPQ